MWSLLKAFIVLPAAFFHSSSGHDCQGSCESGRTQEQYDETSLVQVRRAVLSGRQRPGEEMPLRQNRWQRDWRQASWQQSPQQHDVMSSGRVTKHPEEVPTEKKEPLKNKSSEEGAAEKKPAKQKEYSKHMEVRMVEEQRDEMRHEVNEHKAILNKLGAKKHQADKTARASQKKYQQKEDVLTKAEEELKNVTRVRETSEDDLAEKKDAYIRAADALEAAEEKVSQKQIIYKDAVVEEKKAFAEKNMSMSIKSAADKRFTAEKASLRKRVDAGKTLAQNASDQEAIALKRDAFKKQVAEHESAFKKWRQRKRDAMQKAVDAQKQREKQMAAEATRRAEAEKQYHEAKAAAEKKAYEGRVNAENTAMKASVRANGTNDKEDLRQTTQSKKEAGEHKGHGNMKKEESKKSLEAQISKEKGESEDTEMKKVKPMEKNTHAASNHEASEKKTTVAKKAKADMHAAKNKEEYQRKAEELRKLAQTAAAAEKPEAGRTEQLQETQKQAAEERKAMEHMAKQPFTDQVIQTGSIKKPAPSPADMVAVRGSTKSEAVQRVQERALMKAISKTKGRRAVTGAMATQQEDDRRAQRAVTQAMAKQAYDNAMRNRDGSTYQANAKKAYDSAMQRMVQRSGETYNNAMAKRAYDNAVKHMAEQTRAQAGEVYQPGEQWHTVGKVDSGASKFGDVLTGRAVERSNNARTAAHVHTAQGVASHTYDSAAMRAYDEAVRDITRQGNREEAVPSETRSSFPLDVLGSAPPGSRTVLAVAAEKQAAEEREAIHEMARRAAEKSEEWLFPRKADVSEKFGAEMDGMGSSAEEAVELTVPNGDGAVVESATEGDRDALKVGSKERNLLSLVGEDKEEAILKADVADWNLFLPAGEKKNAKDLRHEASKDKPGRPREDKGSEKEQQLMALGAAGDREAAVSRVKAAAKEAFMDSKATTKEFVTQQNVQEKVAKDWMEANAAADSHAEAERALAKKANADKAIYEKITAEKKAAETAAAKQAMVDKAAADTAAADKDAVDFGAQQAKMESEAAYAMREARQQAQMAEAFSTKIAVQNAVAAGAAVGRHEANSNWAAQGSLEHHRRNRDMA